MDLLIRRPSVPEERDGDEAGEEDARGEAHLGFAHPAVGERHAHDCRVGDLGYDRDAAEEADADAEVGEPGDFGVPEILLLEDAGDGGEEEVEEPVDDGHVERHQRRDDGHILRGRMKPLRRTVRGGRGGPAES